MTLYEIYSQLKNVLKNNPETSNVDVSELIKYYLGIDKNDILLNPQKEADEIKTKRLFIAAEKRVMGYPLQYITGVQEFMDREYVVGEGVLVPREDTRCVIEFGMEYLEKKTTATIVDLCSGSGCIAITLGCSFPDTTVLALEKSQQAFNYLLANVEKHNANNVRTILCDVTSQATIDMISNVDVIISNPPYLDVFEMENLQKEVMFEPSQALYGGRDGFDFYRTIIPKYKSKLVSGGMLAVEVGYTQAEAVEKIFKDSGYYRTAVKRDFNGIKRAVAGYLL